MTITDICRLSLCAALSIFPASTGWCQDARFDDRPPLSTSGGLGSVSLADLDGDGDADVLGSDPTTGRLVWIENNSDADPGFTIEHTIAASLAAPQAAAAGDIDGDGDLDVAAAGRMSSGQVAWFENTGGVPPVFATRLVGATPNLEMTGVVRSVELADLDLDGDLDIVCGFELPVSAASGHVTVYLNGGGASPSFLRFQLPSPSGALSTVVDLAVADLTDDGLPDIAAVSREPAPSGDADALVVWANTGGPGFGFVPSVAADQLADPAAIVTARLTADTLPDIAITTPSTSRVLVFPNDQSSPGSFLAGSPLQAAGVIGLAAGDLVGSSRDDLIAATAGGPLLFENLGGTILSFAASQLASPDGAIVSVALGPIDADADLDVVTTSPMIARWLERVQPVSNLSSGTQHASLEDAVLAASNDDVLRADPEHFVPDAVLPPVAQRYELLSTGDLRIGRRANVQFGADAALRAAPGGSITVDGSVGITAGRELILDSEQPAEIRAGQSLQGAAIQSASSPLTLRLTPEWTTEDIDGAFAAIDTPFAREPRDVRFLRSSSPDRVDLATVTESIGGGGSGLPGSLVVYGQDAMSPTGWVPAAVDDGESGIHRSLAVGDIDRDGDDDLTTVFEPANGNPAQLRLHLADGAQPAVFESSTLGPSAASGAHTIFDLDRDGRADIVTPTGWYRQIDLQTFAFVPFPLVAADIGIGVDIARLNSDFEPDVVLHTAIVAGAPPRAVGFRLVALEADGMGGFVPTVIDQLDRSGDPACIGDCYPSANVAISNLNTLHAADIDHDGDDDIVLSEDQGLTVYETTAGGFIPAFAAPDLPWAEVSALDADGDGGLDLVIASTTQSAAVVIRTPIGGSGTRSELVRPFERVAAVDAADVDGDDDLDLAFVGSGFDRVVLVRQGDAGTIDVNGAGSRLGAVGLVELARGTVDLEEGVIDTGGTLAIRPGGIVSGRGDIIGTVWNGGRIETRPFVTVSGDYAQFDTIDPTRTGSLDVLLPTAAVDPLQVGGVALLAGDLRVAAVPGVVLGPAPRRIVTALGIDQVFDEFETALLPRLTVVAGGQPELGVGRVVYGNAAGESFVELAPLAIEDPVLSRSDFPSLGRPADAVVGDIAGGIDGGPDGLPDLVVAYPAIEGSITGGVALFVGELGPEGCSFRPVGVYQGKNVSGPSAVEIGDFDGDGIREIAFANRPGTSLGRVLSFLDVDSAAQVPLTDSALPPLLLAGDRSVTDLAVITLGDTPIRRGPLPRNTLLTLSGGGLTGTVTAATYESATDDWEVCDIDVCDDPDSFDPIDPDGAALLLGEGFASGSTADDKVLVASNTGGMPETFPTESFAAGANPTELRAEDLNNDGFPDIAVINETSGTVSVFVNIADGSGPGGRSFATGVEWTLRSDPDDPDPLPSSIALADLDDDGDLDIAVVSTDGSGTRVVRSLTNLFVETASLSFTVPSNLPEQPADTPLLVREFDADGTGGATVLNDDLVVLTVESGAGALAGAVSRTVAGPPPENTILCSAAARCVADVNGDGLLTPADFNAWILAFNLGLATADQNGDGLVTPADFNAWILNYNAGC